MQKIRQCTNCNKPSMMPVSRKMQIYNSVLNYECPECHTKLELVPMASIGIQFMVGLLAIGVWGAILFSGSMMPGTITFAIFGIAVLTLLAMTITNILKHRRNPVCADLETPLVQEVEASAHIAKRPILWMEKFGFLAGLIMPILLIAMVLGISAAIGYINFTYFN